MIRTTNPATGEALAEHHYDPPARVDSLLERSAEAGREWVARDVADRVDSVAKLADALRHSASELAHRLSLEMGKPITPALAEIEKAATAVEYFTEQGPRALKPDVLEVDGSRAEIRLRPLGPILAVMPWNFPYWQTLRFALPAMVTGNTVVVKHSAVTTGSGLLLQEVVQSVLPDGIYQTLVVDDATVHTVIAHPLVRGVTLTGSTAAGRAVAASAGQAIKPVVLELGGSDPFVVLDDADVQAAARAGVASRMQNTGQSCIAAKRFIVQEAIADQFVDAFCASAAALRVGDPLDPQTEIGPLAGPRFRDELQEQVDRAVEQGATARLGCRTPEGPGYFYPVSVLTGVTPDMEVAQTEVFGPVAAVMVVQDAQEAVAVANDSPFGLGASVWGKANARRVADGVEAGTVVINDFVRSDARLPFGGTKLSGFGRELGLRSFSEFANVQAVRELP